MGVIMFKFDHKMRGNVSIGVNPIGCKQEVKNQIDYVKKPYYGDGTLGRAKTDCEVKVVEIDELLTDINGKATIVVATAVTIKANSVIPFFPVYCMGLYRGFQVDGYEEEDVTIEDFLALEY